MSYKRCLHKVGQQSYILKQPKDHKKLGSDTRQRMVYIDTSPGALWEEGTKLFNPQVINRITIIITNTEKWSRWCVSYSSGPQREAHPLTGLTVPTSLLADSAAHTLFPAPSALTAGPCTMFILRSQYPNDHQLTGSACGSQNAILSSKYNRGWQVGPGFY